MREQLSEHGITNSVGLAEHLLERFAIAVLPGTAFGDDAGLRTRMASSLLYGQTEDERWEALAAGEEAAALPRVRLALQAVSEALLTLAEGR
jgi:aspartate/methionine/tyrosine aminotransferase